MKSALTRFYIIRHGETEWNRSHIVQGHKDSPLTEAGMQQAKETGIHLKNIHFDKVFSSDLLRAKRTAEIITVERKLAVETTQALREQYFGNHEGMDLVKLYPIFDEWAKLSEEARHVIKISESAESNEEAVGRLITFLREAAVAYPSKTILIVTHGAVMRYLAVHLAVITYAEEKGFDNSGYMILDSDGIDFFVKKLHGVKLLKESR